MRRGFTIIEMIAVLSLMLVAAAIGGELFYKSILAVNAERATLRLDSARSSLLQKLRQDCISATRVSQGDGGITLNTGGEEVTYHASADEVVRRTGNSEMRWPVTAAMAAQGAAVDITIKGQNAVSILAPFAVGGGKR